MSDRDCTEIRLLLPEVALGTVTGQDRARALGHVASCAECRRELQAMVEVADELLLLGPSAEPPVGFESQVLARLTHRTPRRRAQTWAAVATAVVVAALLGAGGAYLAGGADRELADGYRRTLGVADGQYVAARPFVDDEGREIGYVFGYQGSPPWIFCVVRAASDGEYEIELSAVGGSRIAGEMEVQGGEGTWHQTFEVDLHDLRRITLVDRSTGTTYVAEW